MPTNEQIAWAAGLFEGEGTITLNGVAQAPRMKLSMTDFDVVRKFYDIVGEGHLCIWRSKNPKHKAQLCWYTGRKSVIVKLIDLFLGHFGERRYARACEVMHRAMDSPFEGWDAAR
jgi:hypothetical protein